MNYITKIFIPSELAFGKMLIGQDRLRITPANVGGQQAIRSKYGGQYESKYN